MERKNPFAILFAYPLTWLVIAIIAALHAAYNGWFEPKPFFNLVGFGVDSAAFILWAVVFLNSASFASRFNEMPYEKQIKELKRIIAQSPESFRKPALASASLIESINKEFKDAEYHDELLLLAANIYRLANEQNRLFTRYQKFGTKEQKLEIKRYLDQQVDSITKIYDTLQAFSGNLTILAASVEKTSEATNQLRDINAGLREVIQTGI